MKKEGKDLRKYIFEKINGNISKEILQNFFNVKLSVRVEIYENWHTKRGDIKKKDIANREKFLIDSVFKSLELDDCYIFEHTMFKIQSDEEKSEITIRRI